LKIRSYLVALVGSIFVPFTIFAGAVAYKLAESERAALVDGLQSTARALVLAIDRHIADVTNSLKVLATAELLQIGEFEGLHRFAGRVAQDRPELRRLILVRSDRHVLFDTDFPFGAETAITVDKAEFDQAVSTGNTIIGSEIYGDGLPGTKTITLYVPARIRGEILYVLVASLELFIVSTIFRDQKLPADWTGVVLNDKEYILGRSRSSATFVGQRAPLALASAVASNVEGVAEYETQEGWPMLAAFARSATTGWTVVLGMPAASVMNASGSTSVIVSLTGVAVSLLALGLAAFLGRQISHSILGLLGPALAVARGERVRAPATSNIAEIQRVTDKLVEASTVLAEMEQQLRQTQKMEALGQLTGGIAHDFNNLLAVIIGNLEMAVARQKSGAVATELDEASLRAAVRGAALTRQLLAFARRQPLRPVCQDLRPIVAGMTPILERALTVKIRLAVETPALPCWAEVDGGQIEASLLNLAINARDAMPDGGTLTIVLRGPEDSARAGNAEILVKDTGIGMRPEVLARAFEPFFTTKDIGKGSGLGLSMVYGFVRQSGGRIEIDSEPGRGTVVKLYFKSAEAPAPNAEPKKISAPSFERLRVLLVEDEADVRETVCAMLGELGAGVVTAPDGYSALEHLKEDPTIGTILADIAMPGGMDGITLAERAAALRPNIRIAFMSGNSELDRRTLRAVNERPFLAKPFRKFELAAALEMLG
jgi:signal transduction histidine kinase